MGVLLNQHYNSIAVKVEDPNKTSAKKYREIKSNYENRLTQYRAGEINARGYRDSIYYDVENFMIKNK